MSFYWEKGTDEIPNYFRGHVNVLQIYCLMEDIFSLIFLRNLSVTFLSPMM